MTNRVSSAPMAILAILAFVAAGSCILGLIAGYRQGKIDGRDEQIVRQRLRELMSYSGSSGIEVTTTHVRPR